MYGRGHKAIRTRAGVFVRGPGMPRTIGAPVEHCADVSAMLVPGNLVPMMGSWNSGERYLQRDSEVL
jgi:hypothetical protein